jgi:thiamine biosynthesis lipoprotein
MRVPCLFAFLILIFSYTGERPDDHSLKIQLMGYAQGTTWHITYYDQDSSVSRSQIDSILTRIDSSMSLYKPYSLINRFNRSSRGIRVDEHFRRVVEKSLDTYRQTHGIFDITVQPLVEAWGFSAKKVVAYPDSATVRSLLGCVGSRDLQLRGNRLIKKRPCIKIDLDGIAQGYSVDVLADFLGEKGIRDYMVELGGEIRVHGRKQPGNRKITIGIAAPVDDPGQQPGSGLMQKIVIMDSGGITTSGDYRVFHESKGKKFSHTIDPRTGYPSQNELISVTVFSSRALNADAYDNVLMILGLKAGLQFVEKRTDMAAYFIYRKPDGTIGDTASSRFSALLYSDSLVGNRSSVSRK